MHFLTTFITVASVISTTFAAAVPPVVARGVTETCGKQVYSITDYVCYTVATLNILCPIRGADIFKLCGDEATYTCYDPAKYKCFNGGLLCPKGSSSCGHRCYNTSQFICTNGLVKPKH